jgi:hypothetical protein
VIVFNSPPYFKVPPRDIRVWLYAETVYYFPEIGDKEELPVKLKLETDDGKPIPKFMTAS